MEVYVVTYTEVEIKMDGELASWLKAYIQNTLFEGETSEDVRNRKEIFNALNNEGIK